jgi:hypothetical protein
MAIIDPFCILIETGVKIGPDTYNVNTFMTGHNYYCEKCSIISYP